MKRLCVLVAIMVAIPLAVLAQVPPPAPPQAPAVPPPPPPPPPATGKWWKNSATVRELGITDTQVAQLENVYLQHQSRLAGLLTALLVEEQKMKSLLAVERLDENAIGAQMQAVNAARVALQSENTAMTLGMRRLMSAEQWIKLEKFREKKVTLPAPPAPPPPPPPTGKRIIHDLATPGLQEPQITSRPSAPYTAEARQAMVEGIVLMQAVFESNGTISDVRVLRGIGHGMDEAAAKALGNWKFVPAQLNGQPVSVRVNVEMSFRLGK
jgi:TonB family protein